jgi:uncharacterized repeat protein (TIGR04076 family)
MAFEKNLWTIAEINVNLLKIFNHKKEKNIGDFLPHKCAVRVKKVEGKCAAGLKEGDEFIVDGVTVEGRICLEAFCAILPNIMAVNFGANLPWAKNGKVYSACPDPINRVLFEIEAVK